MKASHLPPFGYRIDFRLRGGPKSRLCKVSTECVVLPAEADCGASVGDPAPSKTSRQAAKTWPEVEPIEDVCNGTGN